MMNPRYRPLVWGLAALVVVWAVAWGGFRIASRSKMTAEKFGAYADSLDLSKLQGEQRARALKELADKLNRLQTDERRRARMDRTPHRLFNQMTEEEKGAFIEATMPTGFKQMLASFEQLPADKRQRAIDRSMKQLQAARTGEFQGLDGTNRPPPVSEDLQRKIMAMGLKTFYKESSAKTKAEVAPLLEELQRTMESGRLFHQ